MSSADERMAAFRVALLHPADRAWMLRNLPRAVATRLHMLMNHPTVRAAVRAGIRPDDLPRPAPVAAVVDVPVAKTSFDDHVRGWHGDWAALLQNDAVLPAELAASLRTYRERVAKEMV